MSTSPSQLFIIKLKALLHDPPYKSLCIRERVNHKEEARLLRQALLAQIPLEGGDLDRFENIANNADVIASGFDRWVLGPYYETGAIALDSIANIFDTRISEDIPSIPLQDAKKKTLEVIEELKKIIKQTLDSVNQDKDDIRLRLAYTLLYALYEPLYYLKELPPTLADTRVPTHTIFDHLYATASMVNLVANSTPDKPIRGFLVLVDFPGVHSFIDPARKTGDYWAGSWLLSNVMWRLAEKLISEFGPDVLISPTPRMNPYFLLKYLPRILRENLGEKADDVIKQVERITGQLIERLTGASLELEEWTQQPIIPATLLLVLPKGIHWTDTPESVASRITELFQESWKEIVDEILAEITTEPSKRVAQADAQTQAADTSVEGCAKLLPLRLLKRYYDIISQPPTGVRVSIVDVEEIHGEIIDCLKGSAETCTNLGLNPQASKLGLDGVEELARTLVFHASLEALSRRPTLTSTPVPRTFWILEDAAFKPIYSQSYEDWIPCTQCGVEPAVLRLRKSFKGFELTFHPEDLSQILEDFCKTLKGEPNQSLQTLAEKLYYYFKPGEALGPYCILKRAVYIAKREKSFQSTDDVALEFYVSRLKSLVDFDKVAEKLAGLLRIEAPRVNDSSELAVLLAFGPNGGMPRNLDMAHSILVQRTKLQLSFEEFLARLSESVWLAVRDQHQNRYDHVARVFLKDLGRSKAYMSFLSNLMGVSEAREDVVRRILEVRTRYLIIYGDADGIGMLHSGHLPLKRTEYYLGIVDLIEKKGQPLTSKALADVKESYRKMYMLLDKILADQNAIVNSPTLKAAITLALVITSLKDVVTVKKDLHGALIFAGGDDVVALAPVDVLPATLILRRNYRGENFFHRVNGLPLVSAIPTGRSLSVRVASLFDLMSDEISQTQLALEEDAKKAHWKKDGSEWYKDTVVFTSSRSAVRAVFPMSVLDDGRRIPVDEEVMESLARLYAALTLHVVSSSLPDDFARSYGEVLALLPLNGTSMRRLASYIAARNIQIKQDEEKTALKVADLIQELYGGERWYTQLYSIFSQTHDSLQPLLLEYLKLVKLLRVIS